MESESGDQGEGDERATLRADSDGFPGTYTFVVVWDDSRGGGRSGEAWMEERQHEGRHTVAVCCRLWDWDGGGYLENADADARSWYSLNPKPQST